MPTVTVKGKKDIPRLVVMDYERDTPWRTKLDILKKATDELIIIKKERIKEGATRDKLKDVQFEIDRLFKLRRQIVKAAAFAKWRKSHEQ